MTYTCYKTVPVVRQLQQQCTVMVPQVQQRTVTYTVCRQEMRQMTRQCTVMVPEQQTAHWHAAGLHAGAGDHDAHGCALIKGTGKQ